MSDGVVSRLKAEILATRRNLERLSVELGASKDDHESELLMSARHYEEEIESLEAKLVQAEAVLEKYRTRLRRAVEIARDAVRQRGDLASRYKTAWEDGWEQAVGKIWPCSCEHTAELKLDLAAELTARKKDRDERE